jgi:Domain of unknown function (DUF5615)
MRAWRGESCAPEEGGPRRRLRPETSAGISDDEVLARTNAEGRVLLTEDKDFGDLALSRPLTSCRSSGSACSTRPGGSRPSSWMGSSRGLPSR